MSKMEIRTPIADWQSRLKKQSKRLAGGVLMLVVAGVAHAQAAELNI